MCKICAEKETALKSKIDDFTQMENVLKETNHKIDSLKDELVLKDKLMKGSKEKIDLLEENVRKEDRDYQRGELNNKLQTTLEEKEKSIDLFLDEIAKLKLQLKEAKIKNERINLKLKSYYSSSFVLDYVTPKPIGKNKDGEDVYSNGSGIGYNRVLPPVNGDFSRSNLGVDKALNIKTESEIDKLSENLVSLLKILHMKKNLIKNWLKTW
ncbi:hypothetical protein Hanom_Chr06g00553981 [Helianthus anomalus]